MTQITASFPDFGLTLSNTSYGSGFWLVDVQNWFDGVGPRLYNEARPDGDGDFDQSPVYREPRYPIVVGRVAYADENDLFAARKTVARMWSSREPFTLQVVSPDGTQTAEVIMSAKPTWNLWVAPNLAEFEIPLKAADPRKYGALQSASTGLPVDGGGVESPVISPFTQIGGGNPGRVTLTNNGTTDTIPTLTVSGGGMTGGVEILRIETGELLRLEWPILDTDVVTFDMAEGQVWLNDQSPIAGRLTRADWWTLGAGESTTLQFVAIGTVTGTPVLTATWRDADS